MSVSQSVRVAVSRLPSLSVLILTVADGRDVPVNLDPVTVTMSSSVTLSVSLSVSQLRSEVITQCRLMCHCVRMK